MDAVMQDCTEVKLCALKHLVNLNAYLFTYEWWGH